MQKLINVGFSFFVFVLVASCGRENTPSQPLSSAPSDSSVQPGTDSKLVLSSQKYISNKTVHSVVVRSGSSSQKLNPNECLIVKRLSKG